MGEVDGKDNVVKKILEIMGDVTNQSAVSGSCSPYKKSRKKFRKNVLAMDYEKKKKKKNLKEFIELYEGAEDRGIFKAIFLLGAPGSGKTTLSQKLLKGTAGWKTINPDKLYEFWMKKRGLSMDSKDRPKGGEWEKVYKETRKKLPEMQRLYIQGRLPLLIDRTGYFYERVMEQKKMLEDLGYETAMIFINTPQDVAFQRNLRRERKMSFEELEKYDPKIRKLADKYRSIFSKFWEYKNIKNLTPQELGKLQQIREDIFRWLTKLPNNEKVREWKDEQKTIKKV